jgi:hypothetical protein
MGKITKGILGGVSGLVGTVIGASYRSIDYIRSRPKKSGKTPVQSQIDQRVKFALIIGVISRVKVFVEQGFKPKSKYLSPVNTAVQYNLNNAITGVSPDFSIDFSKLLISNGNLASVADFDLIPVAEGNVTITWDTDDRDFGPDEKAIRAKDSARLVLYNEDADAFLLTGYIARSVGKIDTRAPRARAGNTVHAFLFFVAEDGKSASTSEYLGSAIMLA